MGTVEQDLARYEREQDEVEALEMAGAAIRDEITSDADELTKFLSEAMEGGSLQLSVIANLMVDAKAAHTLSHISRILAQTLADLHVAIEPYMVAEIEKRAPKRLEQWRREAEDDRAEAVLENRATNLYGA